MRSANHMHALIGIAAVFAAVLGGFLLEKGNLYVLLQPAELLIVGGAAARHRHGGQPAGGNRPHVARRCLAAFRPPGTDPPGLPAAHMRMLYEVFCYMQRAGAMELEADVEDPPRAVSSRITRISCTTPPRAISSAIRCACWCWASPPPGTRPVDGTGYRSAAPRADTSRCAHCTPWPTRCPGLGIVAAVLGVVITMQAIGGAPETIGQKVAAALVGTFLGILLCYGVIGPVASRLEKLSETETQFLQVLRIAIVAFARGASPILAVEYARRSAPGRVAALVLRYGSSQSSRDARIPPVPKPTCRRRPMPKLSLPEDAARHVESALSAESRRPPRRRRMEGGLRRFRDRADGALYRALADELPAPREGVGQRILQRSRGIHCARWAPVRPTRAKAMWWIADTVGDIRKQIEQALRGHAGFRTSSATT